MKKLERGLFVGIVASILLFCIAASLFADSVLERPRIVRKKSEDAPNVLACIGSEGPTIEQVSGSWIGYPFENAPEFMRLQLDTNGRGYLSISSVADSRTPVLYLVERGAIVGGRIELQVIPTVPEPLPTNQVPIRFLPLEYKPLQLSGSFVNHDGLTYPLRLLNERQWQHHSSNTQLRIARQRVNK